MSAEQPHENGIDLKAEKLSDTLKERDEKKCHYCNGWFSAKGVGVHEARCLKNPNRLDGYGGKGQKLAPTKQRCRYCKHHFGKNGLATHESYCQMGPKRKSGQRVEIPGITETLEKYKQEAASQKKRVILLRDGNGGVRGFLVNGDNMEPVHVVTVDI